MEPMERMLESGRMFYVKPTERVWGPAELRPEPQIEKRDLSTTEWVRRKLDFHPDPMQARVLEAKGKRGLLNCTRQWGKSTVTAAMAVHEAYTNPKSLTLVISPSARQSGEFVRKAVEFAQRLGLPGRGDGNNGMSIQFPNGARIVGLPGQEATIRGFSAVALLLIDEASRVEDELYIAVSPMLAVSGGRLWLMSTPFGQRGFFWNAWTEGVGWERIKVRADECPRIPKEFLDDQRRSMGARYFEQEYMCEFGGASASLFDRELVDRAFRKDVLPLKF